MSLSSSELDLLRAVAGTMLPADQALDMPGGDDAAILADIIRSIGRDLSLIRRRSAGWARSGCWPVGSAW